MLILPHKQAATEPKIRAALRETTEPAAVPLPATGLALLIAMAAPVCLRTRRHA